ncbi:hypothetical protein KFL_006500080 [Klebsormidium nitens]|uniref:Uncharacterized protein n=1 Tax=Klebsormidium nitens TaxID=105231 RepID=A0A1Y1II89_KLENI|nr:hypothetical protein KFL_006500080 [Klebsormidium nitens]|eukprot:GAQ90514.1 hypothetical protein KFL_006500080 [Klebsormidium nitens]
MGSRKKRGKGRALNPARELILPKAPGPLQTPSAPASLGLGPTSNVNKSLNPAAYEKLKSVTLVKFTLEEKIPGRNARCSEPGRVRKWHPAGVYGRLVGSNVQLTRAKAMVMMGTRAILESYRNMELELAGVDIQFQELRSPNLTKLVVSHAKGDTLVTIIAPRLQVFALKASPFFRFQTTPAEAPELCSLTLVDWQAINLEYYVKQFKKVQKVALGQEAVGGGYLDPQSVTSLLESLSGTQVIRL